MSETNYDYMLDMNHKLKDEYVDDIMVELVSGRKVFNVRDEIYASTHPDDGIKDKAKMIYVRAMHEAKHKWGLLNRQEMMSNNYIDSALNSEEQEQKNNLETIIQQLVKSRDATPNAGQKKMFDTQIQEHQKILIDLMSLEESVFSNSCEARAEEMRTRFLVYCCTFGGIFLDEPVWANWEDYEKSIDMELAYTARSSFVSMSYGLPHKIIRALVRTPSWREKWKASKESASGLFSGSISSWDTNKLRAIEYSNFFDTILAHPDFPGEEILLQEELLQNWINQVTEENKKIKAQNKPQKSAGTFKDGKGRIIPSYNVGQQKRDIKQGYRLRSNTGQA